MPDAYHYSRFLFPTFGHTIWERIVWHCHVLSTLDPEYDGVVTPRYRDRDPSRKPSSKRAKRRDNAKHRKPRKRA